LTPTRSNNTNRTPLVSVITVVLNGAKTLEHCVESVVEQDYPNIEHLVVDGGSSDNTVDILKRIDTHVDRWISEPDRGISDAYNKGIALSHGEIIGLLNCDDWYSPNAIWKVVQAFADGHTDVAYGFMQYWKDSQTPSFLVECDHRKLISGMTIGHPTVFASRSLYERVGLFRLDFRLAMDYEWLLRSVSAGATFTRIPEVIANMTEGGVGDRSWIGSLREVVRARAIHLPSESGRWTQNGYFLKRYILGMVRRKSDGIGIPRLRRLYQRFFSSVRVRVD
jgi:glycosyltransferase involved in cell wall biosynthesis